MSHQRVIGFFLGFVLFLVQKVPVWIAALGKYSVNP
jgi:hypothetical protein